VADFENTVAREASRRGMQGVVVHRAAGAAGRRARPPRRGLRRPAGRHRLRRGGGTRGL